MNSIPDLDRRDHEGDIAHEDETVFQCACGDSSCVGYNDDAANINIFGSWYAPDCRMANSHPHVVRQRELDAFNGSHNR